MNAALLVTAFYDGNKEKHFSGIIQMTNKWAKTGRAGSPLPAERVDCQAAARTE
jgi:hypothetical protein